MLGQLDERTRGLTDNKVYGGIVNAKTRRERDNTAAAGVRLT